MSVHPFSVLLSKAVPLFLLGSLVSCCLYGQGGKTSRRRLADGEMQFNFLRHTGQLIHHDSVLILFDRTDRSGAGIVSGVFGMDSSHKVLVSRIPAGQYFIMVQCFGMHHDYWETTSWVRPMKCRELDIKLEPCEEFVRGHSRIPGYHPNLEKLILATIRANGGSRQRKSFPVF